MEHPSCMIGVSQLLGKPTNTKDINGPNHARTLGPLRTQNSRIASTRYPLRPHRLPDRPAAPTSDFARKDPVSTPYQHSLVCRFRPLLTSSVVMIGVSSKACRNEAEGEPETMGPLD